MSKQACTLACAYITIHIHTYTHTLPEKNEKDISYIFLCLLSKLA